MTIIRRHPLIAFFALAFLIGWSPWPFYAAGLLPDTNFLPTGPLAAALIVAGATGTLRDLGARMIRWRAPWWCYLAAVGLPLAVIFTDAGINVALGGTPWSLSDLAWADLAVVFALRWVDPLDGPLGEEPGWRGFALPRLWAAHAPLISAAILGVLVAVWHLPLLFAGEGNPIGWVGIPSTFVITFVYCWLFRRSTGSVLLTMLFHVVQGTIVVGSFGYTGGADLDRMLWLGLGAWTVVALALILFDRAAWRPSPPAQPAAAVLTTAVVQR